MSNEKVNKTASKTFKFKTFAITQEFAAMKLSTDAVLLGSWTAHKYPNAQTVLDIGTGTGILSLIYASFNSGIQNQSNSFNTINNSNSLYKSLTITALDIDEGAIKDADNNFKNSNFKNYIQLLQADVLVFSTPKENQNKFDLIICNPPYFIDTKKELLKNEARFIARHNTYLSIANLLKSCFNMLSVNGIASFIVPFSATLEWLHTSLINNFQIKECICISSINTKEPYVSLISLTKEDTTLELKKELEIKIAKHKLNNNNLLNNKNSTTNTKNNFNKAIKTYDELLENLKLSTSLNQQVTPKQESLFLKQETNSQVKSKFWEELAKDLYLK